MHKKLIIITCLFLQSYFIHAQQFDINDFNQKFETAQWLCTYDLIAWWSSDSVMTKPKEKLSQLGREWFCFQDEANLWHAVFGKYQEKAYKQVLHFIINDKGEVQEVDEKIDPDFLYAHGKALNRAYQELKPIQDSTTLRFNHYIRKNQAGNFEVFIFPGYQPSRVAIYGGEFIYEISSDGEHIIKDDSYYQGQFRGFETGEPRDIWLNYRELDKPTLGSIFFAWYYKGYFTKIHIDNKLSFSLPIEDGDQYIWMHKEKEKKKEKKKKDKHE